MLGLARKLTVGTEEFFAEIGAVTMSSTPSPSASASATGWRSFSRRSVPWLLGIVCLAVGLRWFHLGAFDLWYDEACSAFLLDHFSHLLEDYHPPLYYLMLHGWSRLFGSNAVALRSLSVVGSVLAIPLVWRLANDLGGRRVAILSALWIALSPYHIWYAQEARGYAWLTFFVTLAVWCWWRWLGYPDARRYYWGFVCAAAASIATAYGAAWSLAALPCALVGVTERTVRRRMLRPYVWVAVVGVLLMPLVALQGTAVLRGWFWIPPVNAVNVGWSIGEMLFGYENASWVEMVLYGSLYVYGLLAVSRARRDVAWLLLATSAIPVLLSIAVSLWRPLFLPRQLMPVTVSFWIAVAFGAVHGWQRVAPRWPVVTRSLAALLVVCLAHGLYHQYADVLPRSKPPYRPIFEYVRDRWQPGDLLVHTIPMTVYPAWYYGDRSVPCGKLLLRPSADGSPASVEMFWGFRHTADQPITRHATLEELLGGRFQRAWVLYGSWERDGTMHPDGLALRRWIGGQLMSTAESVCVGDILIERYDRSALRAGVS